MQLPAEFHLFSKAMTWTAHALGLCPHHDVLLVYCLATPHIDVTDINNIPSNPERHPASWQSGSHFKISPNDLRQVTDDVSRRWSYGSRPRCQWLSDSSDTRKQNRMMSNLHLATDPSAHATWMESIVPAWILSIVSKGGEGHPTIKHILFRRQ